MLRGDVAGSKSQDNFSFRIVRKRQDFLSLPRYLVILQRISRRDTLAIHNHKLPIQIDTNVYIIQPMPPFLVDLILECKFYVAAADLTRVDEE